MHTQTHLKVGAIAEEVMQKHKPVPPQSSPMTKCLPHLMSMSKLEEREGQEEEVGGAREGREVGGGRGRDREWGGVGGDGARGRSGRSQRRKTKGQARSGRERVRKGMRIAGRGEEQEEDGKRKHDK